MPTQAEILAKYGAAPAKPAAAPTTTTAAAVAPPAVQPTAPTPPVGSKVSAQEQILAKYSTHRPIKTARDAGAAMALTPTAINLASQMGSKLDSVTGAPTRAGLMAAAKGQGLRGTIDAFTHQFAGSPEKAPTGEEIAREFGVSDAPVRIPFAEKPVAASKIVGGGIDLTADYTNVLPTALMAKALLRTGEAVGKVGTTGARVLGAAPMAEGIEAGYKGAKRYLHEFFNPKIAEDFEQSLAIAERHGIDPKLLSDSVKYGNDSFIARKGKQLAEGVGGQERLLRHNSGVQAIAEATDRFIVDTVGRGYGPQTVENAGDLIRDAYNKAVSNTFQDLEFTYQSAGEQLGIQRLAPKSQEHIQGVIDRLGEQANWRAKNAATIDGQKQGRFMQKQLENLQGSVLAGDYQEIVQQMQEIGRSSYVSHSDIGWDEKAGREMYEALREGVLQTVDAVNPGAKTKLEASNQQLSKFLSDMGLLDPVVRDPKKGGEVIFRDLVEGGNSRKLEALKAVIGGDEDAMAVLKATYVDSLKKMGKDGEWSFNSLGRSFRNDARTRMVAEKLFSPEELQELGNLVSLGEKHGTPVLSTSGTGASNSFRDTLSNLKAHTLDESTIAYLKRKADAAKKRGQRGGPSGGAQLSFSGVEAPELSRVRQAVRAAQNVMPSRHRIVNKGLQTYSVQDSAVRRRLKKD